MRIVSCPHRGAVLGAVIRSKKGLHIATLYSRLLGPHSALQIRNAIEALTEGEILRQSEEGWIDLKPQANHRLIEKGSEAMARLKTDRAKALQLKHYYLDRIRKVKAQIENGRQGADLMLEDYQRKYDLAESQYQAAKEAIDKAVEEAA